MKQCSLISKETPYDTMSSDLKNYASMWEKLWIINFGGHIGVKTKVYASVKWLKLRKTKHRNLVCWCSLGGQLSHFRSYSTCILRDQHYIYILYVWYY